MTLEVVDAVSLKVIFSTPADSGGDTVISYLVEWDVTAAFDNSDGRYGSSGFTMLSGGAPYVKTITDLDTGVFYYVRVSAANSQGFGPTQASSPVSLNPHEAPGSPTNVVLGVTSASMLTVSFDLPDSDGGDEVIGYRVEWDQAPAFNSVLLSPNKGYTDVGANERSYTIEFLTENVLYYVRVAAINAGGVGTWQRATPESTLPTEVEPGVPVSLQVAAGSATGEIDVVWARPRVPHHGIPCYGTTVNPTDCPMAVGGSLPASDGGIDIAYYLVEWSASADFSGDEDDAGEDTSTLTSYTITGLTSGKIYYVRVYAYNSLYSAVCEYAGDLCSPDEARVFTASA